MMDETSDMEGQERDVVDRLDARFNEIAHYCARSPSSTITDRAPEHMALYQDAKAEILALRSEIIRLRSQVSPVPEGWKLVPIEPTEAMLEAPAMADWAWRDETDVRPDEIADCYRAMLAVAPPPPVTHGLHPRSVTQDAQPPAVGASTIATQQVVTDATDGTGPSLAAHLEQIPPAAGPGQRSGAGESPAWQSALDAAVAAERERVLTIVTNTRGVIGQKYVDPDPKFHTVETERDLATSLIDIAIEAIRSGHGGQDAG